ncbi:MAG: HEAT repeat domain-containing protein [Polyangia bacterium]
MAWRRLLVPALLLLILIAAALYTTRKEPSDDRPAAPTAGRTQPAAAPSPPPATPFKWNAGQRRTYSLSTVRTVRFRSAPGATEALSEDLRLALSASYSVTVLRADAYSVLAEVRLGEPKLDLGSLDAAERERMQGALLTPFYLMMEPSGRLRGLRLARGTQPVLRGFLKAVAASLQYARAPGPSWTHDEVDATGEYQARYQLAVDGTRCDKSRLRYTRVAAVQGLLPIESLGGVGGELHITYTLARTDDEAARVEALQGTDTLTVDPGPGMPRVSSESQIALRLLRAEPAGDLTEALQRAEGPDYEPSLLGVSDADPDSARRADERVVQGARFEDLLTALRALPPGDDGQERASLHMRLSALMRLDPKAARKAQQVIAQGAELSLSRTLVGALGGAGTGPAQEALVQVGESTSLSAEVRMNAVAALGLAEQPEEASAVALQRLASDPDADVRSTALLAMGNAALAQRQKGQGGEAEQSIDTILLRLQAATTEAEQTLCLEALGNGGDPRALPALQSALRAPSVAVRKAAAHALRFLPSDGSGGNVDQLLTEVLLRDPAAEVRKAALFAVSFRSLLLYLPALQQLVLGDPDGDVRLDTVRLLGKALSSAGTQLVPGVLSTLRQVAERDKDANVRQAAQDVIAPSNRK